MSRLTLKDLKNALYSSESPVLYAIKAKINTEEYFLDLFFPREFQTEDFFDENQKCYSLKNIFLSPSQRNKVFNRMYNGHILHDNIYAILELRPSFWEEICANCRRETAKAADRKAVLSYLKEAISGEISDSSLRKLLLSILPDDPGTVLTALIMHLLLQGEAASLISHLFVESSFDKQFSYIDVSQKMLRKTFCSGDGVPGFSSIVEKYYDDYSELLSHFASIHSRGEIIPCDHLLDKLYEVIESADEQKLIQISGPAGSEKKAVTQLLYLKMVCNVRSGLDAYSAPFYVNLSFYENLQIDDDKKAKEQLSEDFRPFLRYCSEHPRRTPVLFVDGLKNYTLNELDMDYTLNTLVCGLEHCIFIIAAESGVLMNPNRQKRIPAFAAGDYSYQVRLHPVYFPGSEDARAYVDQFCKIYLPGRQEELWKRITELGINQIDTYQLRMLLPRLWDASDIADLYESVCLDCLEGSKVALDTATSWAFDFAYTDLPVRPISGKLKELLNAHETILEFLIARWYLDKIREGTMNDNIGTLDLVLPKGVTRFIVPLLNRSASDESRVLDLIERNYRNMGVMAKSEMTYWLGRIKSPGISERAEQMLLRFYEAQKEVLSGMSPSDSAYKQALFLLRGISVSLIVKGHTDIAEEYILSMIENKLANEINRGFHLEYYGDKPYIPVFANYTLDFMDDITKGKRSLDQLISANEQSIKTGSLPPVFELNLFTTCSLLQARVECTNPNVSFDLIPYLKKACAHATWYINNSPAPVQFFKEYLLMIIRDFSHRVDERNVTWDSVGSEIFAAYSARLERTGWVEKKIPHPETVAEHMYHAWLLGMMFLPSLYPGHPDYSKEKILNLLLIHDIAESITGDIAKPRKRENLEKYQKWESEEMGLFMFRCSYPDVSIVPENYHIWQLWNKKDDDINGQIAHEMDTIQAMFQLLDYVCRYPECFQDEDVMKWLEERHEIRSAPGSKIYRTIIAESKRFQAIFRRLKMDPFP